MGERGARNEEATPDDIAAMARIVQEAVEAGATRTSSTATNGRTNPPECLRRHYTDFGGWQDRSRWRGIDMRLNGHHGVCGRGGEALRE